MLASGGPATVPRPVTVERLASQRPAGRRRGRRRRAGDRAGALPRRRQDGGRRRGGDRRRRRADRQEPDLRRRRRGRAGLRQRRQPARRAQAGGGRGWRDVRAASTPTRCARSPASRSAASRRSATPRRCRVFVDPDLLGYDEVWAAAGTWHDVFAVRPADLVRASGGTRHRPQALATGLTVRTLVGRGGSLAVDSAKTVGVDGDERRAATGDDWLASASTSTSSPSMNSLRPSRPASRPRQAIGRCSGVGPT